MLEDKQSQNLQGTFKKACQDQLGLLEPKSLIREVLQCRAMFCFVIGCTGSSWLFVGFL